VEQPSPLAVNHMRPRPPPTERAAHPACGSRSQRSQLRYGRRKLRESGLIKRQRQVAGRWCTRRTRERSPGVSRAGQPRGRPARVAGRPGPLWPAPSTVGDHRGRGSRRSKSGLVVVRRPTAAPAPCHGPRSHGIVSPPSSSHRPAKCGPSLCPDGLGRALAPDPGAVVQLAGVVEDPPPQEEDRARRVVAPRSWQEVVRSWRNRGPTDEGGGWAADFSGVTAGRDVDQHEAPHEGRGASDASLMAVTPAERQ